MIKRALCRIIIMIFCFLYVFSTNAENAEKISGVSTLELSTPVSPEIKEDQQKLALDSLSNFLTFWINEFFDNCLQPRNPISKYFLDTFIALCKKHAKEKTFVEGRKLTTEFIVTNDILDSIIASHNSHYDSRAFHFWNQASTAQKSNDDIAVFNAAVKALFYSMAHIGSPINVPDAPPGTKLTKSVQSMLQKIINRINISFSNPIITGKPPNFPQSKVTIYVKIDSIPFPYFPLIAFRPDGKMVITVNTDSEGIASLANMKIPFVAHGAFLYIQPNLGASIDKSLSFDIKSFGLKLTEKSDQTLIFNIIKPVYALDYKATSVNQMEIPTVFSDIRTMHKFLTDSCFFEPSGGGKNPDISLQIQCQISNYTHDDKEQTQIKVESKIIINELKPKGSKVEKIAVLNDKYYEIGPNIPIGLFFWESSNALRALIKEMLDAL